MPHAIGFHPERQVQRRGWNHLHIVGALRRDRGIDVGAAHALQRPVVGVAVVLGASEHQVLEEVRKTGPTGRLISGAHLVPQVDRHDGRLPVGVHDCTQPIGQRETLEGDVHRVRDCSRGERCRLQIARSHWRGENAHRQRRPKQPLRTTYDNAHGSIPRKVVAHQQALRHHAGLPQLSGALNVYFRKAGLTHASPRAVPQLLVRS